MLKDYYFNKLPDDNGFHEIHHSECNYLPSPTHRFAIGKYSDCENAIKEAKTIFPMLKFDGCYYCSPTCHNA